MKTQIVTLASHDDLVSIRDRMSWAKSPRILLIWPAHEQIALRALDLRILQQHAAELGAQMGLVSRQAGVRRDAESFGIPVFRTTAEAQRERWTGYPARSRPAGGRVGHRASELRRIRDQLHPERERSPAWPVLRFGSFVLAVLAVFSLASLFIPRATVILRPETTVQSASLPVDLRTAAAPGVLTGNVPAQTAAITVKGEQTLRVQSRAQVPTERAEGSVRFENLTPSSLVLPAGTVVYSVSPSPVRFATTQDAHLDGRIGAVVDVPIVALEAGAIGNAPPGAILGIEGSLGASASVTNPEAVEGGADTSQAVPSKGDGDQLRASLLEQLIAEAQSGAEGLMQPGDVMLPGTLALASIEQETFDPPLGQPASVLHLAITATYHTTYVRFVDLQQVAEATLNASLPPDYAAQPETLEFRVAPLSDSSGSAPAFDVDVSRTVARKIDVNDANRLVRGKTASQALEILKSDFPLTGAPEIRMTPAWWPWMPLIPFRILVVAG